MQAGASRFENSTKVLQNITVCRQAQAELENEGTVEATSAREEKEMQALLEMFAMGVGAVDEFQAKLQEELSALEVRSQHIL